MVWQLVKDAVTRLFGPDPRVPVETPATKDDGKKFNAYDKVNKEARIPSAFLTPQQFKDLEIPLEGEHNPNFILAAVALAFNVELIDNLHTLEAEASLSKLVPAPLYEDGTEKTLDRTYPVWPVPVINSLLDLVLEVTSDSVPDMTGNVEAMVTAQAEGVKIRDFPAVVSKPEVFDAHQKALDYHYMRALSLYNIFDLPPRGLTVDDVDRLYIAGFIRDDPDFITARMMLGHGALRRFHRQKGLPMPNGKIVAPRGCWTISTNSKPPTRAEIENYISDKEIERFTSDELSKRGCEGSSEFPLPAALRPRITVDWLKHHFNRHGEYGLKKWRIGDKAVERLIKESDPTYIPPARLAEYMKEHANSPPRVLFNNCLGEGVPVRPKPSKAQIAKQMAAAVSAYQKTPAKPVAVPFPTQSSSSSTSPKGKKRASPDADADASNDGPYRRTRARLMETKTRNEPGPSSLSGPPLVTPKQRRRVPVSNPMPEVEPVLSAKAQGKKRAREEEPCSPVWSPEAEDGCSPTKKQKGVRGPVVPALATTPATPIASPTKVDAGATPQSAPVKPKVTPQPLRKPLQRPPRSVRKSQGPVYQRPGHSKPESSTASGSMSTARNIWSTIRDGLTRSRKAVQKSNQ